VGSKKKGELKVKKNKKVYGSFIFAGVLLFTASSAFADDYTKYEASGDFMFINTPSIYGGQGVDCAGAGGTLQYNFTSLIGFAADLGWCKGIGLSNEFGVGSKVGVNGFNYLFGPRLTWRHFGRFQPFADLQFGATYLNAGCHTGNVGNACGGISSTLGPITLPSGATIVAVPNPNATSVSQNAFSLSVGGGFDLKFNKNIAWRLVQADYLYTQFGNGCPFAYCGNHSAEQNSFRLKSGIVFGWGAR
jgi:hypothetical protein